MAQYARLLGDKKIVITEFKIRKLYLSSSPPPCIKKKFSPPSKLSKDDNRSRNRYQRRDSTTGYSTSGSCIRPGPFELPVEIRFDEPDGYVGEGDIGRRDIG